MSVRRTTPGSCQDGGVADSLDAPLRLVLGDEELLASRAVAEVVAAARGADPQTDVRELAAGELTTGDLYDLLSPSLFGGRRVVVLQGAQETKTDVVSIRHGPSAPSQARYHEDAVPIRRIRPRVLVRSPSMSATWLSTRSSVWSGPVRLEYASRS